MLKWMMTVMCEFSTKKVKTTALRLLFLIKTMCRYFQDTTAIFILTVDSCFLFYNATITFTFFSF